MKVRGLWGLEIEPSKTYEFSVDASFRISMASINSFNGSERTSVFIEFQNRKFTLCSLIPEKIEQQVIDITCLEGEKILFGSSGPNCIHLTGNYVSPYNEDSEEEEASESDVFSIAKKEADLEQTPYSSVTAPHRYDDLSSLTKDDYEGPSFTTLNDDDNDVLMDVDEKDLIAEEDIEEEDIENEDEMFKMRVIFDYFNSINSQNKEPEEQPETKLEPEYGVVPEITADPPTANTPIHDLTENEKDETKSLVSLIKDEPEIIEIPSGQTSDVEFDSHEIHTETTDIETEPESNNKATNQKVESKKEISDVKEPTKTESKNSDKKSTHKNPDTLNDSNSVISNNSNTTDKSSKSSKKKAKKKQKAIENASKKANNKSATSNNVGTSKKNKGSAPPPIVSAILQQVSKSKPKLSNNDNSKKAEPSTNSSTKSKKSKAKKAQPISIPTTNSSPSKSNGKSKKSSKKDTSIPKAASNTPNTVSKKTPKTEKKIDRDYNTSAGLQAEIEKSKVRAKEIDLILAKRFEASEAESDIINLVSPNHHAQEEVTSSPRSIKAKKPSEGKSNAQAIPLDMNPQTILKVEPIDVDINSTESKPKPQQHSTKAERNKDEALKRYPKRTRAPDFEKNLEMMAKGDALMAAYVSRSNLKKRKRNQKRSATNSPSVS